MTWAEALATAEEAAIWWAIPAVLAFLWGRRKWLEHKARLTRIEQQQEQILSSLAAKR